MRTAMNRLARNALDCVAERLTVERWRQWRSVGACVGAGPGQALGTAPLRHMGRSELPNSKAACAVLHRSRELPSWEAGD